jgi:hypothetical protein
LELWVGDALDRVFMADANGRFTSAVSRSSPGDKIWVHQIDGGGKRLQSVGISVAWGGAATPLAAQPLSDGSTPPPPNNEIDPFAQSPPNSTAGGLPTVEDLGGSGSLGETPPPAPSAGAFDAPAEQTSERFPTQLEDATTAAPLKPPPSRGIRALGEAGLGFAGGLVVGFAGALLGVGIGAASNDPWAALGGGVLGALVGATAGIPLGVMIGGKLMDGNGSLLATIGGEAVGILLSIGLTALSRDGAGAVSFLILPVAGAVLGYELTSDDSASGAAAEKRGLRSLRPTIAPTAEGKPAFGLSLRF